MLLKQAIVGVLALCLFPAVSDARDYGRHRHHDHRHYRHHHHHSHHHSGISIRLGSYYDGYSVGLSYARGYSPRYYSYSRSYDYAPRYYSRVRVYESAPVYYSRPRYVYREVRQYVPRYERRDYSEGVYYDYD